jgi:hypothetical protein
MRTLRLVYSTCIVAVLMFGVTALGRQLPLQPARDAGQGVSPAFEGWYQNPDGSYMLLDQGQPTHFLPRRGWGVFTVKGPKDFGDKRLTWTITANGQTNTVPIGLIKGYQVEPFLEAAQKNEPPKLRFDEKAGPFYGPPAGIAATLSGTVGQPLTITGTATDGAENDPELTPAQMKLPPVSVFLSKYRGPGSITFSDERPRLDAAGKFSSQATFSAPGEYIVRVQANDRSGDGGGGFQCCWTNAHVKVTISGSTTK